MSYAKSIDGLNTEVTTGKVAQSIDSLDMLLSTSEGAVQDGIVLLIPANGDINVSVTPSFDWDSSTAYDAYKILIDADETFSSPIEVYVTASDYAQTTALLSATGYFWKVVGGNVTDRPAIVPVFGQENDEAGDKKALADFYVAMDGPNWDDNTGWSADPNALDLTNMFGVVSGVVAGEAAKGTRVIELNLSGGGGIDIDNVIGNGLTGSSIDDSFGNLKRMKQLRLKGNNITARIDNWVQKLESIVALRLSNSDYSTGQTEFIYLNKSRYNHPTKEPDSFNAWTGPIPDLDMLTNLELFEGTRGRWEGPLPSKLPDSIQAFVCMNTTNTGTLPTWDNCSNMSHLYIGNRYMADQYKYTGDVPATWNIMPMVWFQIEKNKLTNMPEMPNWNDMKMYITAQSDVAVEDSSPYPEWLFDAAGKNQNLHTFKPGTLGVGEFPQTIVTDTTTGAVFDATHTFKGGVFGAIPSWFFEPDTQQFYISGTGLTSFPANAVIKKRNKIFNIFSNQINSPLPEAEIDQNNQANVDINLSSQPIYGSIPASWENFKQRQAGRHIWITIRNTNINGLLPAWLADLGAGGASYEKLFLTGNKFLPKDIVPNYTAINAAVASFDARNQQPFGNSRELDLSINENIEINDFDSIVGTGGHINNQFQWEKDGTPITNETSPFYIKNNAELADSGEYVLVVTNTSLPSDYIWRSELINLTVTEDPIIT